MFLRWKLDKNGNKMPDAKCPKCKSDAFNSYTCLKCDTCHWCWDGEGDGWYDEEKEVKDVKVEPSTYFHEKNHKWKWMPFSKREAEGKKMDKP